MNNEVDGQAILQRAVALREESEEIERQLQFVTEQVSELHQFIESLKSLKDESDKEILASIGKGVHMKVARKNDEKLFVEVGAGVVVRKTPKETEKVVLSQIQRFQEAKIQLTAKLQENAAEFREMLATVEKIKT